MKVSAVVRDLMLFSRIESAARVAGAELKRVDAPHDVAPDADLVLVDWSEREPEWPDILRARVSGRVVLFGPHVDRAAHAEARAAGLGPVVPRSRLIQRMTDALQAIAADA